MINYVHYADFYKNSVDKQLIILYSGGDITNTDIYSDNGFTLTEGICSGQQLKFGTCEAAEMRLKIASENIAVDSLVGETLDVNMVVAGDTANPLHIGEYKVFSDTPDRLGYYREVVAYDALYDVLNANYADWYENLGFPMTLKQFRDAFFSHVGITQETVSLPNDSVTLDETISTTSLTGKDILYAICELAGRFGHLDRSGRFVYVFLPEVQAGVYPAEDLFPSDTLYPAEENGTTIDGARVVSGDYSSAYSEHITKLTIRDGSSGVGVSVGSGTNEYVIQNNFLLYNKGTSDLTAIGTTIYNEISQALYQPCEMTVVGNPCFEVGDVFNSRCRGTIVRSYVLNRKLTGVQSLRDVYTAKGKDKVVPTANTIQSQIQRLNGRQHEMIVDIDTFRSTIYDGQGHSRIDQNAQAISLEVSRATGAEGSLSSRITVNANAITLKVSKDGVISAINQTAETIKIEASKIDLSGYVTITSLSTPGATTIDGANITTGTLNVTDLGGSFGGCKITTNGIVLNNGAGNVLAFGSSIYIGNEHYATVLDGDSVEVQAGQLDVNCGSYFSSFVDVTGDLSVGTLAGKSISWEKLDLVLSTDYVLVGS